MNIEACLKRHDYSKGSPQREWLEGDLYHANLEKESRPWLLVMFHRPMYSSNEGGHESDLELRGELEQLLIEQRVDMIFSGHEHNYERTYPVSGGRANRSEDRAFSSTADPIHLVLGTGGRLLYRGSLSGAEWSAAFDSSTHGFGVLELVREDLLDFTFYDDEHDSVVDSFTLSIGEPTPPQNEITYEPPNRFFTTTVASVILVIGLFSFLFGRHMRFRQQSTKR